MSNKIKLVSTLDGSLTFYNQELGQCYHSTNGALQEARHVFLENGLQHFLNGSDASEVSVLEVGFGSGLNFLVSADYCEQQGIRLNYTGLEPFPLDVSQLVESHYNQWINNQNIWDELIRMYGSMLCSPVEQQLGSLTELKLICKPLEQFHTAPCFDLIYFDAFAPVTQPELWVQDSISHAMNLLKPNGYFITYSITGNLKRILKALGYTIERPKGAAGKREMLRALASKIKS